MPEKVLSYYHSHGVMSGPGAYAGALINVQANLVYVFWAERYGLRLAEEQKASLNQRSMVEKLGDLEGRGLLPLRDGHPLEKRHIGR